MHTLKVRILIPIRSGESNFAVIPDRTDKVAQTLSGAINADKPEISRDYPNSCPATESEIFIRELSRIVGRLQAMKYISEARMAFDGNTAVMHR